MKRRILFKEHVFGPENLPPFAPALPSLRDPRDLILYFNVFREYDIYKQTKHEKEMRRREIRVGLKVYS